MDDGHSRPIRLHLEFNFHGLVAIPGKLQASGRVPRGDQPPFPLFTGPGALKHSTAGPWLDRAALRFLSGHRIRCQRPPLGEAFREEPESVLNGAIDAYALSNG